MKKRVLPVMLVIVILAGMFSFGFSVGAVSETVLEPYIDTDGKYVKPISTKIFNINLDGKRFIKLNDAETVTFVAPQTGTYFIGYTLALEPVTNAENMLWYRDIKITTKIDDVDNTLFEKKLCASGYGNYPTTSTFGNQIGFIEGKEYTIELGQTELSAFSTEASLYTGGYTFTLITKDAYTGPPLGGGSTGDDDAPLRDEVGVLITHPRDGYKQAKLNAIGLGVYYLVPYDGDVSHCNVKIDGYLPDKAKVYSHTTKPVSGGTMLEGFLEIEGAVAWNEQQTLTVIVTDYNGDTYTASVHVTCYQDFLDEDGDGKDDRTGEDEFTGNPDFDPNIPEPDPDKTILDYIADFGDFILRLGQSLVNATKGIGGLFTGLTDFLGSFFSWLPGEILAVILLGITVLIVIAVIKFIKG